MQKIIEIFRSIGSAFGYIQIIEILFYPIKKGRRDSGLGVGACFLMLKINETKVRVKSPDIRAVGG